MIYSLESILRKRLQCELDTANRIALSEWLLSYNFKNRRTLLALDEWAKEDHDVIRQNSDLFRTLLSCSVELRVVACEDTYRTVIKSFSQLATEMFTSVDSIEDPMLAKSLLRHKDYVEILSSYPLALLSLLTAHCDPRNIFTEHEWKVITDKANTEKQSDERSTG